MTDMEQKQVTRMRKEFYSYKKIAKALSISENTVKSFCKRNGLGGLASHRRNKPLGKENQCLNCGLPIQQIQGRKIKKFCTYECRMAWWKEHPEYLKKKANYEFVCANCKKTFIAYGNKTRKYCSHECYIEDRFGPAIDK